MKGRRVLVALLLGALVGCGGGVSATSTPTAAPSGASVAAPVPSVGMSASSDGPDMITDRYADGLPRSIDGSPVLRGPAALTQAWAATDDALFLVGGWVTYLPGPRACPFRAAGDTSWLHDCVSAGLSDVAGADDPALTAAVTFRFVLGRLSSGPVVAKVEVHDPRAATCGSATAACDRLMVVEGLVWTGDSATEPRPLSAEAVRGVLQTIDPTTQFAPFGPDSMLVDCGQGLSAARLYLVTGEPDSVPAVSLVEVLPTPPARARALALATGPAAALGSAALACTDWSQTPTSSMTTEYRWLAVQNVVVLVRTHHRPTSADRAVLEQLTTGLERAAASGS